MCVCDCVKCSYSQTLTPTFSHAVGWRPDLEARGGPAHRRAAAGHGELAVQKGASLLPVFRVGTLFRG